MGHLVSRMHGGPGLGPRAACWCAWSLWALSVVTTATALTYSAIHPLPAKIQGSLADGVIVVTFIGGFATVGALLAWKRAANPIGWLMCGTALSYAVGGVGQLVLLRFPRTQALGDWLGWAWLFGVGLAAFVLLLFPTGALPSRRWRPVAWAGAAGLAGWVLGNAFAPTIFSDDSHPVNPFGIGGVAGKAFVILAGGGAALVAVSGVAAIVSLVFRYRHARTVECEQLKWLVYAAALIVVAHLASIGAASNLQNAVTSGAVAIVPIAIGVAIFRYHLYDIDLVINKTLVYGSLAAFISGAYVAIVVGIGSLVQHRAQPSLGLSILATAVVAVAFQPVRERVQRLANRLVYGKRATPYEVLSEFSARMGETHATEDLLPQMAQLLADGTGAIRADVWLTDASELRPAASWPPDAERPRRVACEGGTVPGVNGTDRIALVRHHGEFLGALSVTKRPGESLTPTDDKLISDLASQAGPVLRNVGLTGQLLAQLAELQASRQRIVAAQDDERRRIERNIHDGAQRQLVALAAKLGLAESIAGRDDERQRALVGQLKAEVYQALQTLRDLAQGIYPPLLADQGLAAAVRAHASKAPVPVQLDAEGIGRYPKEIEATTYFCCVEALHNARTHASTSMVRIHLAQSNGELAFAVEDDGRGFDQDSTALGSGLQTMSDRLAALGGRLEIDTRPGSGTRVAGRIPIPDQKRADVVDPQAL
jgi:signal transduction histidine kinase